MLLFGIELIKIYLIGSNVSFFENCKNGVNPSTLMSNLGRANFKLIRMPL